MAKEKGRLMLIKIGDGDLEEEVFTTLCGLRSKTLTINNGEVDVTTAKCGAEGDPLWAELLEGVKSVGVSGNGFFTDTTAEGALLAVVMSATPIRNFRIIVPELATFEGPFLLSSVEYGGEQDNGVTYSLSLSSAGEITMEAA